MSPTVGFNRLCFFLNNLNINHFSCTYVVLNRLPASILNNKSHEFHTTNTRPDLMEFFDKKENWGVREVRVGRAWKKDELRIKSNTDLHKLWYVLLKEKNMLLTMQHEYRKHEKSFPNPERIDKVDISMENLEEVVRERNRAYHELETGETGERPTGEDINCFGLPYRFKKREFPIEKRFNEKFLASNALHNVTNDHKYVNKFLNLLNEKKQKRLLYYKTKAYERVCEILKIFPHVDEEALKAQFPDVDIEAAKKDKRSRCHGENAY